MSLETYSLKDHALEYGYEGWQVLPLRPREKRPLTSHGVKDASTDPNTIREWWARWPYANIGLAVPAGLIVLDVDSREALAQMKAKGWELPCTSCAKTQKGWHLWYSIGEAEVGNRVGLRPGVDVRGRDGYVVAPPSVHPLGSHYHWKTEFDRDSIALAPDWLIELLQSTSKAAAPTDAANDWRRKVAEPVLAGRRNHTLAEVSGLLFRTLPAEIADELARCWAQVKLMPQLPEHEVRRTIDSIAGRELKRRGVC
jgi:hypothetical protein